MYTPTIFAIAGAPASGKSTFIQEHIKKNFFPKDIFLHDCDACMTSLNGYQSDLQHLGSVKAFQNWELPAREKAEFMLMEAVKAKKDIIYDRSCALPSSYAFLKNIVENHGYMLIMHILYVTEEEAFFRAEEREKKTGRHIPRDVLSKRMNAIKSLWPSYQTIANSCYLHDSNDKSYNIIAMKKNSDLIILNEKCYEAFIHQ
ncbi:MAG: zeta toxin family protein [Chlamydiales bacterium]|nr:zeta toxin family protein [Chlamydiales bacterium]